MENKDLKSISICLNNTKSDTSLDVKSSVIRSVQSQVKASLKLKPGKHAATGSPEEEGWDSGFMDDLEFLMFLDAAISHPRIEIIQLV